MFVNTGMALKHDDDKNDIPRRDSQTHLKPSQKTENTDKKALNDMLYAVGQNKDREAFIGLFEYFAPRVKSFLMKGGAKPEQADELAQETMLTIWNKAEMYDPKKAAASTWIDAIRKNARFDVDPADPLLIEDDSQSATENMAQLQETERLAEAIKTLPEEQADLIRKSFFEDKSHAVIAEETGIALGTVKSRIRLALERLRKESKVKELWH